MKNLIFINGSSCVGKTTICNKLMQRSGSNAYLDADWTRLIVPYTTMSDEIRRVRVDTIATILRNYIVYEDVDNIYFSWIMRDRKDRYGIIEKLDGLEFKTYFILLTCSEHVLRHRMKKRNKTNEQIQSAIDFSKTLLIDDQIVVDTGSMDIDKIVDMILSNIE